MLKIKEYIDIIIFSYKNKNIQAEKLYNSIILFGAQFI